jgi:acid phosphatase
MKVFFLGMLALCFCLSTIFCVRADNGVPRPDHVVIVVEENRSFGAIIGSANAPYINALAPQGALFTSSFAITHPSQPNYLALFSGSTQGVGDDSCPHTFRVPNLASELLDGGFAFAGYSESMPGVGYKGCSAGSYERKHNPWVNFTNVPAGANLPFTSFPTNFVELPDLAIVVPNQDNDMHDGSVARGDAWLHDHVDSYVQWAVTNNSLFILTWDEGHNGSDNRIVTLFVGPMVRPGEYCERLNHYNVLRTLLEMYGLAAIGKSTNADPITSVWTAESAPRPVSVEIANPTPGAVLLAPATIALSAEAASTGSEIVKVEFFQRDGIKLGEATNTPFAFNWTNVAAGSYCLVAKATDALGRRKTSTSSGITVINPDHTPPVISITNPLPNARVTDSVVTLQGTASDNVRVALVRVDLGDESVSTTNVNPWSLMLTNVPPGTNTVLVEAVDSSGNHSQLSRTFFRSVLAPLGWERIGAGTVSGQTNGALLEIGVGYSLVARPDPGNLFAGWTGSTISKSATLKFLMDSNLNFTATFVTNLFPLVKGAYNGLFYDPNDAQQNSSGFLTMMLGDAGAYSGKLLMNGKSFPVSGTLGAYGFGGNIVFRPGTNPLALSLSLDLTNGTGEIIGTVSEETPSNAVWTANLIADRVVFDARNHPSPQTGKYTLIIPVDTNSAAGPGGDGLGTVTVSAAGAVSFSGTLADGTRVTQKTTLSKDGYWPFYVPLYKGKGSLISWVTFTNETDTDFDGRFNWFKQTQTAKYYPGGFTNEAIIAGSRFVPPVATNLVINITNGIVGFTNGNLTADFTNHVMLDAKGKVLNQGTNKLSLTISKSSGTFSGSVMPPGGGKAVSFKGALLQKQNVGSGFFLGTNASGRVSLLGQ